MAYDRDSFLAGLAVGRTLWRPHRDIGGGNVIRYRVKRSDIDQSQWNWWIVYQNSSGFNYDCTMRYPDTYYTGRFENKDLSISWIADSDYSWKFTYDVSSPLNRTTVGIGALWVDPTNLFKPGYRSRMLTDTIFVDLEAIINGVTEHLVLYHANAYITPGVNPYDLSFHFQQLLTTKAISHMEGIMYMPVVEMTKQ